MLEFQEKNKIRNILYSKITLFALFVIIVFIARAAFSAYHKQKVSGENLTKVKEEAIELEKREKMLNSEIDRLKTEKGAEEEIRKKFMVGKVGEQVIVIVDNNKTNKDESVHNGKKKSFFSKILDIFRRY